MVLATVRLAHKDVDSAQSIPDHRAPNRRATE